MEQIPIKLGDRKLQFGSGAHILNVPRVAVCTLGLETGDVMRWSMIGTTLHIRRVVKGDSDDAPATYCE